jgi:hypothetical protein
MCQTVAPSLGALFYCRPDLSKLFTISPRLVNVIHDLFERAREDVLVTYFL